MYVRGGVTPEKAKAAETTLTLSNPRIVEDDSMEAGQKVTWNCVWFGSYPQAEVVPASEEYTSLDSKLLQDGNLIKDDALYQKLQSATGWDSNGDIEIDGEKYRRITKEDATYADAYELWKDTYYQWESSATIYHYFIYQPIKWRVLSADGSKAFLLADKALDGKQYLTSWTFVTWETCTMRSWLNGYGASLNQADTDYTDSNFLDTAFSGTEQSLILTTDVENKNNLSDGTEGGNDTKDKIFLLSESEVYTDAAKQYGFSSGYSTNDEARRAKSSLYAKAMGICCRTDTSYVGDCRWWLRSPGINTNDIFTGCFGRSVYYGGWVSNHCDFIYNDSDAVWPALNLNLASSDALSSFCSYAGTVCSDEMSAGSTGSDNDNGNISLKTQKITVTSPIVYKAKTLKKKAVSFSLNATTDGDGTLTYAVTKYPANCKKYIKVSAKGKVTLKKGIKKGTYKITVTAAKTAAYKKTTKVVTVKIK